MSLEPVKFNFKIRPAATFYKRITYKISGSIVDLSEYKEAWLVIKDEPKGNVLLELKALPLGGAGGTIDITITAKQTSELTWENGTYELFLKDPLERVDVIATGGFKVIPF